MASSPVFPLPVTKEQDDMYSECTDKKNNNQLLLEQKDFMGYMSFLSEVLKNAATLSWLYLLL